MVLMNSLMASRVHGIDEFSHGQAARLVATAVCALVLLERTTRVLGPPTPSF